MIKNGMLTILYYIFFPLGDSRCWMFAGAHGLKATCYLWDQWEDRLLATLAPPIYPILRFCIVAIIYTCIYKIITIIYLQNNYYYICNDYGFRDIMKNAQ